MFTSSGEVRWVRDWSSVDYLESDEKIVKGIIIDVLEQLEASKHKGRIDQIAESLPGAVFHHVFHSDGTDSVDYMSSGCEEITGYTPTEFIEDQALRWSTVLDDDLPDLQDAMKTAVENLLPFHHEWRIRTKSGDVKWISGHGQPVRDVEGTVSSMTVALDITDKKESEALVTEGLRKTIHSLAAVIEARDPYTAGHEEKVAALSVLIGREIGLEEDRLTGLQLAATVHDIGKISIPSEILSKPSKLTPIEFELIKQHSTTGANLLRPIEFPWPIADIVEQHHERCDGTGYPHGLTIEELLLESRILAVADTLEAVANHRPYRAGLGIHVAIEIIIEGAGTAYDLSVVDATNKLYNLGALQSIL